MSSSRLYLGNQSKYQRKKKIKIYDENVSKLCKTLFADNKFNKIILTHPWLEKDVDANKVFNNPKLALVLLVYMKAHKIPLSEELSAILDVKLEDVPELGRQWWQILIEGVLFSKTFYLSDDFDLYIKQLKRQLKSLDLLHKNELSLERSRRVERSLGLSTSKIKACCNIHKLEYKHRGNKLKQVILTDYIRDEEINTKLDLGNVNLGAWPVFKFLISESQIPKNIALISGRLTIIHRDLRDDFVKLVEEKRFRFCDIEQNNEYYKISGPLNQITNALTTLLINNKINVLVGTRSLLGEGWDAPCVNSLVLASSVGSFMLTNQMRGRAIRIDKNNPEKVSSIWHLVAINEKSYSGFRDFYNLENKFDTFVGLSEKKPAIESGFFRLNAKWFYRIIPNSLISIASINNRKMIKRFKKVFDLKKRWNDALILEANAKVRPTVQTEKLPNIRKYHLKNTLLHLLSQIGLMLSTVISWIIIFSNGREDLKVLLTIICIGIICVLLYNIPKTITVIKILIKHLPVAGSLKQIGIALCETLCQTGHIETYFPFLTVNCLKADDGSFFLALDGGTFYESSLFADCLAEIFGPIDKPRYIIIRKGRFFGLDREDYHSVPTILGVKKEFANIFYKNCCKKVCPTELIYTRMFEGKKKLLKAKGKAFSSNFEKKIKRLDKWQ